MKRIITGLLAVSLILTGCKGQEAPVATRQTTEQLTKAKRVLAEIGVADEKGYYSIDLPRSADDLIALDLINSRLCWISAVMVEKEVKSFDIVPHDVLWQTVRLEAAFNYGSTPPFKERQDGKSTLINRDRLMEFCSSCFYLEGQPSLEAEGISLAGEEVTVEYTEPRDGGYGFVMTAYKQEAGKWHIKGELMSSGERVFSAGEFVLEDTEGLVPYRVVSFKEG